jgi:hypothetical protein
VYRVLATRAGSRSLRPNLGRSRHGQHDDRFEGDVRSRSLTMSRFQSQFTVMRTMGR